VRFRMRAARPRARARQRLSTGPSSTKAAFTTRSSPIRLWFASAFATAERSSFSTSRAAARSVNASTVRASGTVRPRMCSTTSRALRGEIRTHFAAARTSCRSTALICTDLVWPAPVNIRRVACSRDALHLHLAIAGVGAESPRRSELAELVADHLLGDEDRDVLAPVVDRDRVPDHLREDGGGPRPGANHVLRARGVHLLDSLEQTLLDERALLRRAAHRFSFPRRRLRTIRRSDSLCLLRVRLPSVGTPHGVAGWRPPLDLPSPPPCGWSTGFMAEPRTVGRLPRHRLRPAFPPEMFSWSTFPTWPTVARQVSETRGSGACDRRLCGAW